MRVAICTCFVKTGEATPHGDYVEFTNKLKQEYTRRHENIDFLYSSEHPHPGRDPHFCKFAMLLYALGKEEYDWAIWMDGDAAPVNMEKDVSKLLESLDGERIVMQKDINDWNSGVFAVPKTEKAMRWLLMLDSQDVHDHYKDASCWDQNAIIDSFTLDEFKDFAQEPPPDFGWNDYEVIYSYYGDNPVPNVFRPDESWCLHIPGYGDIYRRNRFSCFHSDIIGEHCPVCGCLSQKYFSVPFNKKFVGFDENASDEQVEYHICPNCELIYAPSFRNWTADDYRTKIYNDDYARRIDPDFESKRAEKNFDAIGKLLCGRQERHLDYAGGNGRFSQLLCEKGLYSDSYDLFYGNGKLPPDHFRYSVITCMEGLEHIFDANKAFKDFSHYLMRHGVLVTTTQLWDAGNPMTFGHEPSSWPLASPRNGHVCIYGKKSLRYLAARHGFMYNEKQSDCNTQIFEKL